MTLKLIFDIGANNGDDAAFYLAKGFNVIAVEADPVLCAAMAQRFAAEIKSGALIIENVGVAGETGKLDFYVNSYSEWSSFDKDSKATSENTHKTITIPTIPMVDLIVRHGTPYYLKIDIEGFEKVAIGTLVAGDPMPDYLSFEICRDWTAITDTLESYGYRSFTVVRQGRDILPDAPQPAREGHTIAQKFKMSMSGCFGREIDGPWLSKDAMVADAMRHLTAAKARRERGERPGWFDIHCRLVAPD